MKKLNAPSLHSMRMKSLSHRRQSAPSMVITKALTRSRTLSRDCIQAPFCPETCPLVQSFLVWSDRVFLLHGHAQLKTGLQTQDRHLFLFNNMLVIAKAKSGNQFKQKAQVRVCEMWTTSGCMAEVCEGSTSPESSFVMGWPTCNCVAMFSSTDQKEKWLSLLQSRIKEEKEKEEPKTIPLKVYGKGINSLADIKTLAVSNCDSTNEVVRLALQQFGIAGNVKDYQLWVFSKRDNAPYPLIGHEFPFSIQMGHVRELPSQGNKDAVLTPDRQMVVQAELLLQANKQCQFILKRHPSQRRPSQQREAIELSQKPFKRKRSIINWAFWRGSSTQLDDSSMSLSSPASGCLFGQPLSSVCLEDALPQPIMDMLVFLYHEGSWTRGIFRRSAGAKAVRELRDSLDSGLPQLPLTRDHVFIISGVFKDFLRNIPGSLLCSDRYEEWMDILDESQGVEEQAQDIQRLIVRLPTENVVLLRHLLCLLHGIQGNAPDNQMTSFNLSVCIAPSMLWPPGTCSPQLEGEMAKKVCDLVKFMIDHCQKITGQNPATLFGGPPQSLSTKDIQPDPWPSYPLTDSSFDSLENELDDYSGGSPSFPTRRGGCRKNIPLQGSLDSILTLSDNDQDAADPDVHRSHAHQATRERCFLQLPPLGRPRGRRLAHPACPIISQEGSPTGSQDLSSSPEDRCYRFRRCSEPAIAYATELQACTIGSGQCLSREDGNNDDNEEEHLKAGNHSQAHADSETLLAARLLPLEAGGSFCLSSPRTSPAPPTRSPLDSLPSMCREGASQAKRDPLLLAKTAMLSVSTSPTTSASTGTVSDNVPKDGAGPPDVGPPGPNGSPPPPRELPSKETLKSGRGLHPNAWLKDVRRPSLNQQDSSEKDDGERTGGGHTNQSVIVSKRDPEKGDLLVKLKPEEMGRMVNLETPSSGPQPLVKPESSSSPSPQGAPYPQASHGILQAPCPQPSTGILQAPCPQPSTGILQAPCPQPSHRILQAPCPQPSTGILQGPPCPQPSHSIRSLQRAPCPQPSHSQLTVRQLRDIHTQACQQQHTHLAGDINELKLAVPQTMVFGQTSPALTLFRKNKTHSLSGAEDDGHASLLSQRRSSEPEAPQLAFHLERFSRRAVRLQRLPGEPEALRVSEVDIQGGQRSAKPPLCSFTCTAQGAVKDYVLSRPRGSPQSSQPIVTSLVESRRAWLRRCSDPMAPPPEAEPDCPQDLEQMFAEESFV